MARGTPSQLPGRDAGVCLFLAAVDVGGRVLVDAPRRYSVPVGYARAACLARRQAQYHEVPLDVDAVHETGAQAARAARLLDLCFKSVMWFCALHRWMKKEVE